MIKQAAKVKTTRDNRLLYNRCTTTNKGSPHEEQAFCYLVACVMQHKQGDKASGEGQDNPRQPPII